ncbi:MAG: enoyl-CoA hydratase/isomerase family protein [Acidimicrobiales bacterium]
MSLLQVERPEPAIAVVTLDRPERRNALSVALRDELVEVLGELAGDDERKVVVITGRGPVFCSGFDLREFEQAMDDEAFAEALWASSDRYHRAMASFPLVTVAALNGPAVAGGFDLAVLCDLRVAATTTTFSHPEHAFGDVVYRPLADLVGGAVARDLCLTGRIMDAGEALDRGLVRAVVEPDAVLATALDVARAVAVAPRDTLLRTKAKAVARAGTLTIDGTLDL